jgi:hypothetical protein
LILFSQDDSVDSLKDEWKHYQALRKCERSILEHDPRRQEVRRKVQQARGGLLRATLRAILE